MTRYLAARLTALFAGCALLIFGAAGVLLYRTLETTLMAQARDEMMLRGAWVESLVLRVQNAEEWRQLVRPKLDAMELQHGYTRVTLLSDDVAFQYGRTGDDTLALARSLGYGQLTREGHPCQLQTWTRRIDADGDRPGMTLVLVHDPIRFWETLQSFRLVLVVMGAAGVAVVALLGWGIARVGLRPLQRLSRQAQALAPQQRGQRLALQPMSAELGDLTDSFNGALQRLEDAYQQLEAFNADVAHELRTPLNNLIGQTQVALARPRDAAALQEVLQSNLEELERLKHVVNDMLFLARADQGAAASRHADVAIADEVARVAEYLEPMADEQGVRIAVQGDAQGPVETSLLRRALGNLLQNAIEHSHRGDEVLVTISRSGEDLTVAVSNPGPAIAPEHLPHLFDRFYRVDSARRNVAGNHGLGLAIVKAIAAMHRGRVFARSERGLNTFGLTLPARG